MHEPFQEIFCDLPIKNKEKINTFKAYRKVKEICGILVIN